MRLLEIPIECYDRKTFEKALALDPDAEPEVFKSVMTVDLDKVICAWEEQKLNGEKYTVIEHGQSTTTVLMPYEDFVNKWAGKHSLSLGTATEQQNCDSHSDLCPFCGGFNGVHSEECALK